MTDYKIKDFVVNDNIKERYFSCYSDKSENFVSEAKSVLAKLEAGRGDYKFVWIRFHLSDIANQIHELISLIAKMNLRASISYIEQAPVNNVKIAVEAYMISNISDSAINYHSADNSCIELKNYTLNFFNNCDFLGEDSYTQMMQEFKYANRLIRHQGGTLENNLIRTWIYCRDIDNNYARMVDARNDVFDIENLTRDTHYIASTGIEARMEPFNRLVQMDSLAIFNHEKEQMEYLKALDHLSETHVYGVAFERGVRMIFGDRSHYYVSGTASIDKNGAILHPYDIKKQTYRMVENVKALLANHDATLDDITQYVVYLRDISNIDMVKEILAELLGDNIPNIIVASSVCRPKWLIEMDAIAVNTKGNKNFKDFI